MSYQHIGPKQESAGRTGLGGRDTISLSRSETLPNRFFG